MAAKNFRSTLLEPTSEFAHGDKLRFTALSTSGSVFNSSFSEIVIGDNGQYSVDLQYGKYRIDYKPYDGVWQKFADVEVSASTLATSLQALALSSKPVTDDTILTLQSLLADAESVKGETESIRDEAEAAAEAAAQSAIDSANALNQCVKKRDFEFNHDSDANSFELFLPHSSENFFSFTLGVSSAQDAIDITDAVRISVTVTTKNETINHHYIDGEDSLLGGYVKIGGYRKDATGSYIQVFCDIWSSPLDRYQMFFVTVSDMKSTGVDIDDIEFVNEGNRTLSTTDIVREISYDGRDYHNVSINSISALNIPRGIFDDALMYQRAVDLFESEKSIALQIMSDYQLGLYSITEQDITDTRLYIQSIEPLAVASSQRSAMPRPQIFTRYKKNPYEL